MKARDVFPPRSEAAAERWRERLHEALTFIEHAPVWLLAEYHEHVDDLGRVSLDARYAVGEDEKANKHWSWDGSAWTRTSPTVTEDSHVSARRR